MGSTGTVLVLLGVGAVIFLLVMYGFIDIPFLHRQEPNQWRIDISAATEGGTVDNIQALASVNPRGIIFVDANEPLQVNASDFAGWIFSYWLFDNATYGETPYVVIPAQASNSTHTLIAVFEPKIIAFQITPIIVATRGSQGGSHTAPIMFNFINNEPVTLGNVRLKLNDPYGVFVVFYVQRSWYATGYAEVMDVLNAYASENVLFNSKFSPFSAGNYYINPSTTSTFAVGACNRVGYLISSDIPAGTYNLTWEIQFTVASGSFSEPPELTIPWQVTILG